MDRMISTELMEEDIAVEGSLRPQNLSEYIGQEKVKKNLRVFIEAAKMRGESLDHVLLYGPPGLGKTTLAGIIANEMDSNLKITSGPAIEKPGEIAAVLNGLSDGDVLFIDEIHRLNRQVEEVLYPAMEDFSIDIMIGKGASAKSIRLELPHFTLVGATTRAGMLTAPLRDRFGVVNRLEFYTDEELKVIVERSAELLGVKIDEAGAMEVGKRSRGTPRLANRLLKRVRDFAQVRYDGMITYEVAQTALNLLEVDSMGLDATPFCKWIYLKEHWRKPFVITVEWGNIWCFRVIFPIICIAVNHAVCRITKKGIFFKVCLIGISCGCQICPRRH